MFERSLSDASYIAVKVNMLIDTASKRVQAKIIMQICNTRKHHAKFYHSTIHRFLHINVVVILCVKFEYSTINGCKNN